MPAAGGESYKCGAISAADGQRVAALPVPVPVPALARAQSLYVFRLQLTARIHAEKASMAGARGLWGIETR